MNVPVHHYHIAPSENGQIGNTASQGIATDHQPEISNVDAKDLTIQLCADNVSQILDDRRVRQLGRRHGYDLTIYNLLDCILHLGHIQPFLVGDELRGSGHSSILSREPRRLLLRVALQSQLDQLVDQLGHGESAVLPHLGIHTDGRETWNSVYLVY